MTDVTENACTRLEKNFLGILEAVVQLNMAVEIHTVELINLT